MTSDRAVTRRSFLAFLAADASMVGAAKAGLARAHAQAAERTGMRTRLVLLGTAGGPTPKVGRAVPAQAIVAGSGSTIAVRS